VKSILASFPGGLAVGASIAAVLAAAAGLYRWSVLWYRRTIGSRRDLTRRFNQLAAGVTTRWVEERLGAPDIGAGIFDASAGGGPQWCQEGVLRFKDPTRPELPVFDPKAAYAAKFRANTTINTLTVLGPWRKLADLAEPRGPDSNHVRVLLADSRERRRRRRLVRQWNRRVLRVAKRQALNLSRAGGSGGSG